MRCLFTTVICLILLPLRLSAAVCEVTSDSTDAGTEGGLPALIRQVAESGACLTNDAGLREEYKAYLAMAQEYHLIRWRQSMDIRLSAPLPALQGYQGRPLVLRVDPGTQVRIVGVNSGPILIEGTGGPVILDRLILTGFASTAVKITSDGNTIWRSQILDSGALGSDAEALGQPAIVIAGQQNRIGETKVTGNRGVGIAITAGPSDAQCIEWPPKGGAKTTVEQNTIADNDAEGVVIQADSVTLTANQIHDNAGAGVRVRSESSAVLCAEQRGQPIPETAWHTAIIQRNQFWQNGDDTVPAIAVTRAPLVPPVDLIVVTPPTTNDIVLVGNISRQNDPNYPWREGRLNFAALHVEIYLADGPGGEGRTYLTTTAAIDPGTRQFIVHLPSPLLVDGEAVSRPIFTALVVDTENHNTSPFAHPVDVAATLDWDDDGIPSAAEDLNHDGAVDVGETDPRLADSDGDGLTDGAERLLLGPLSGENGMGLRISDPQRLDPRNPDSDGDCLPDGLEAGIGKETALTRSAESGSVLARPRIRLSSVCEAMLAGRSVLNFPHGVPWDANKPLTIDNIAALYDSDPTTRTDPSNPDTDGDGVPDGTEDWNIDGVRSFDSPTARPEPVEGPEPIVSLSNDEGHGGLAQDERMVSDAAWLETDPTLADSDGDGLLDGEEGDRNGSGSLEESESNPLLRDTDGDGVSDADEIKKYGSLANQCDSDNDGLGDGIEAGVMNPRPVRKECQGLQTAGSNFASLGALQLLNPDSDNDGLPDGAEDENANGYFDPHESDPTIADTDNDGMNDYAETTGDFDRDGISDVDLAHINNGPKCAPPPQIDDVDCDGQPNVTDEDADNDGCSDAEEGIRSHGDLYQTPAAYNAKVKACGTTKGGGSAGGTTPAPSTSPSTGGAPTGESETSAYFSKQIHGGGGCSLIWR